MAKRRRSKVRRVLDADEVALQAILDEERDRFEAGLRKYLEDTEAELQAVLAEFRAAFEAG